jgi:protein gp37
MNETEKKLNPRDMELDKMQLREPFSTLFEIKPEVLGAIEKDMQEHGYDRGQPIVLWKGKRIIVDGHTRYKAAQLVPLTTVTVIERPFEDEAFDYAVHHQRDRRNLTDGEIRRLVQMVHERKARGGDRKSKEAKSKASGEAFDRERGKGAEKTAKKLGVSTSKVERALAVNACADEATKRAVDSGEMTLSQADEQLREMRREEDKEKNARRFNKVASGIDWAGWSWNPVVGCVRGCKYCYARDRAMRQKIDFRKPRLCEERLGVPERMGDPRGTGVKDRAVFVCSMGDLFGKGVPRKWIESVLEAVRQAPKWRFVFLTKNPRRLVDIKWPRNAWVGVTTDNQKRADAAVKWFKQFKRRPSVTFVSCEPFVRPITFRGELGVFDWLAIGGRTKTTKMRAMQPKWRWVEDLLVEARNAEKDIMVYFKPNLTVRPDQLPGRRGAMKKQGRNVGLRTVGKSLPSNGNAGKVEGEVSARRGHARLAGGSK